MGLARRRNQVVHKQWKLANEPLKKEVQGVWRIVQSQCQPLYTKAIFHTRLSEREITKEQTFLCN